GGEVDDLIGRERARLEQAAHDRAHRSGGTDDRDPHAADPDMDVRNGIYAANPDMDVRNGIYAANSPNGCSGRIVSGPASSKAAWSARTASGTRSPRITQEMRIGEVEIISMLMSCSPSV